MEVHGLGSLMIPFPCSLPTPGGKVLVMPRVRSSTGRWRKHGSAWTDVLCPPKSRAAL
jgi:hypothetical protein